MQFDGLEPFKEGFPTIAVGSSRQQFDLHNDADLREITLDCLERVFRITWALKEPAWKTPSRPETQQRKTVAGVGLIFSGIRSVTATGMLVNAVERGDAEFDFLEYSRMALGVGQLRLVLQNAAEISIIASRCQLHLIDMP